MEMEQQQVQLPIMIKSRFKRICVYCGSTPGKNPSYQIAAIQLGKQLVIMYIYSY
jgi:predicted Rossmann-fold nucleotide-binding protein